MVAIVIIAIMVCVISLVFMIGYILDIFVSTFIALTIGLAIDYSVHIAHFYVHSDGNRFERAQHSLAEIAISVIGGAVTTIACGIPLFAAPTSTNSLFGYAARHCPRGHAPVASRCASPSLSSARVASPVLVLARGCTPADLRSTRPACPTRDAPASSSASRRSGRSSSPSSSSCPRS